MFGFFKRSQQKEEVVENATTDFSTLKEEKPKTRPATVKIVTLSDSSVIAIVEYTDKETPCHPETYIRHSGSWHYFNGDPRFTTHGRVSDWVGILNQYEFEFAYQHHLEKQDDLP